MKLIIRGAVQVKNDSKAAIIEAVSRMYLAILERNSLEPKDINCVILSQTKDLRSFNAATAVREFQLDEISGFPLFCCQEADVEGSLPRTVRIMVMTDKEISSRKEVNHVYLDGASSLRPDLSLK